MKRASPALFVLCAVVGCDALFPAAPPVLGGGTRDGDEGEGEEGEGEEGEGEEGEGEEGEGEGGVEGEGEAPVGEGEGEAPVGEGEGEAPLGEGEGEGEGVFTPGELLAQLTWVGTDTDLDVRGVRANPGGEFCAPTEFFNGTGNAAPAPGPLVNLCSPSELSCSFSNCADNGFGAPPDWDLSGTPSDGDPAIDIDDLEGFGPENLNVVDIVDGDYVFGAFAYNAIDGDCATLRVFVDGALELERTFQILDEDWVEVARVAVRGASTSVTASATTACP